MYLISDYILFFHRAHRANNSRATGTIEAYAAAVQCNANVLNRAKCYLLHVGVNLASHFQQCHHTICNVVITETHHATAEFRCETFRNRPCIAEMNKIFGLVGKSLKPALYLPGSQRARTEKCEQRRRRGRMKLYPPVRRGLI